MWSSRIKMATALALLAVFLGATGQIQDQGVDGSGAVGETAASLLERAKQGAFPVGDFSELLGRLHNQAPEQRTRVLKKKDSPSSSSTEAGKPSRDSKGSIKVGTLTKDSMDSTEVGSPTSRPTTIAEGCSDSGDDGSSDGCSEESTKEDTEGCSTSSDDDDLCADTEFILGFAGESCTQTCERINSDCAEGCLDTILTSSAFSAMVESTTSVNTLEAPVPESAATYCTMGANTLSFADGAPASYTFVTDNGVSHTYCTYPTSLSGLTADCDTTFLTPPSRRFCSCKPRVDQPSVAPTPYVPMPPTPSTDCTDTEFILGFAGESCTMSCARISSTCKEGCLDSIVTAAAFSAMVESTTSLNKLEAPAPESVAAWCTQGVNYFSFAGAPASYTYMMASDDGVKTHTYCTYPTSRSKLTADCDTTYVYPLSRRFCACVKVTHTPTAAPTPVVPTPAPTPCDDNEFILGFAGETCTMTCARIHGTCIEGCLDSIVTYDAFSAMVESTTSLDTSAHPSLGTVATFCTEGVNVFAFAEAPASFSYYVDTVVGKVSQTYCTYPTSLSGLTANCHTAYLFPPSRRFCSCKTHEAHPSAAPTPYVPVPPTPVQPCDNNEFILGFPGESCTKTCDRINSDCKEGCLDTIVTADAFSAMVAAAVSVDPLAPSPGSVATFCTMGVNVLFFAQAPAAYTYLNYAGVSYTYCTYPSSLSGLTADCETQYLTPPSSRFCSCGPRDSKPSAAPTPAPYVPPTPRPADCDESDWILGYAGESCTLTCARVSATCIEGCIDTTMTAASFSAMVESTTSLDTLTMPAPGSVANFCNQGVNYFEFAGAPASYTYLMPSAYGEKVHTYCTYPTTPSGIFVDCHTYYIYPPSSRFCSCKTVHTPTVAPTPYVPTTPAPSKTPVDCTDTEFILGLTGESCTMTCARIAGTCKEGCLDSIVTADAFSAMVESTTSLEKLEAQVLGQSALVGSVDSFCNQGVNEFNFASAPASFTYFNSYTGLMVHTYCTYPTSLSGLTANCDTSYLYPPSRRFCACACKTKTHTPTKAPTNITPPAPAPVPKPVPAPTPPVADCDGNDYILGFSGESCGLTCARVASICAEGCLDTILNAQSFSAMVEAAISLDTVTTQSASLGTVATFCTMGVNVFNFAEAPAAFSYQVDAFDGKRVETYCTYPTSLSGLTANCDTSYPYPPSRRFCSCKKVNRVTFHPTKAPTPIPPAPAPQPPTGCTEFVLGRTRESCTLTCARVSGTCNAANLLTITTREAFDDLVDTAFRLCPEDKEGSTVEVCNAGVNNFVFAQSPALFTYLLDTPTGKQPTTYCTYPTTVTELSLTSLDCDIKYIYPPSARFCSCELSSCDAPEQSPDPTPTPTAQPTQALKWVLGFSGESCDAACAYPGVEGTCEASALWSAVGAEGFGSVLEATYRLLPNPACIGTEAYRLGTVDEFCNYGVFNGTQGQTGSFNFVTTPSAVTFLSYLPPVVPGGPSTQKANHQCWLPTNPSLLLGDCSTVHRTPVPAQRFCPCRVPDVVAFEASHGGDARRSLSTAEVVVNVRTTETAKETKAVRADAVRSLMEAQTKLNVAHEAHAHPDASPSARNVAQPAAVTARAEARHAMLRGLVA